MHCGSALAALCMLAMLEPNRPVYCSTAQRLLLGPTCCKRTAVPNNCLQAGLDSLGSVELRNAVGAAYNFELPATAAFDYPTVAALARFVASQLPTVVDAAERSWSEVQPSVAMGRRSTQPRQRRKLAKRSSPGAASAAAVTDAVAAAAAEVLGAAPARDQPLMEVRTGWCTATINWRR